jgi:uncharacterized protein YjeT (DUF2065 family)
MAIFTHILAQVSPEAAKAMADAKTARMVPILALGIVFILGGIALFLLARQGKDKQSPTPKRKSDERALAVDRQNNTKMRTAGGILAGFGAVLIVVSQL